MSSHRAWRLWLGRTTAGGSLISIAEFELLDSGSNNLVATVGGSHSSSGTGAGAEANAFDGSSGTTWGASGSVPFMCWIEWDFGSMQDVATVSVTPDAMDPPDLFLLEVCDLDGTFYFLTQWAACPSLSSTWTLDVSTLEPFAAMNAAPLEVQALGRSVTRSLGNVPAVYLNRPGGAGSIAGHVEISPSTPVSRIVRLNARSTGQVVATTRSDASTGAYRFDGLPIGEAFQVVAVDETLNYNAVIKDNVMPEVLS